MWWKRSPAVTGRENFDGRRRLLAFGLSRFPDAVPGSPAPIPYGRIRLSIGSDTEDALAEKCVLALERQTSPVTPGPARVGHVPVALHAERGTAASRNLLTGILLTLAPRFGTPSWPSRSA